MARIEFQGIRHSYGAARGEDPVYALKEVTQVWEDGGAYALLGPSGCGKTTLLNIISGLLKPSQGHVLFDGKDVTALPTTMAITCGEPSLSKIWQSRMVPPFMVTPLN